MRAVFFERLFSEKFLFRAIKNYFTIQTNLYLCLSAFFPQTQWTFKESCMNIRTNFFYLYELWFNFVIKVPVRLEKIPNLQFY
jgi:hypothetical protein